MTDRNTLVLIDASCLVSACASPNGGSGFVLSVCRRGYLRAASSQSVLVEAERNITKKLGKASLAQHHESISTMALEIAVFDESSIPLLHRPIAGEKDAHVITAAVDLGADYVITLDRPLISRINSSGLQLIAMTPGEFIKGPLLRHPDYAEFRAT